jgi:hypothetical protein
MRLKGSLYIVEPVISLLNPISDSPVVMDA